MGFWYLLLLLIGVVVFIAGLLIIKKAGRVKGIVFLVIGGLLVALSIFLFSPNSSEIIADLFNLW